jgi:mannosyl-glycoprotein endo-beta-N-acetylglucosaminidase
MKNLSNKKKIYILGTLIITYFLIKNKKTNLIKSKILTQKQIDFINLILPSAKVIEKKIGVPYQFIVAQLCLESGYGKSSLTSKYFNFGGIKQLKNKPYVSLLTTECKNGVCKKVYQNFAIFKDATEGLTVQAEIYANRNFKKYLNKTSNPYEYVKLLQSGTIKYATSPNYVKDVSNVITKIINSGY